MPPPDWEAHFQTLKIWTFERLTVWKTVNYWKIKDSEIERCGVWIFLRLQYWRVVRRLGITSIKLGPAGFLWTHRLQVWRERSFLKAAPYLGGRFPWLKLVCLLDCCGLRVCCRCVAIVLLRTGPQPMGSWVADMAPMFFLKCSPLIWGQVFLIEACLPAGCLWAP